MSKIIKLKKEYVLFKIILQKGFITLKLQVTANLDFI